MKTLREQSIKPVIITGNGNFNRKLLNSLLLLYSSSSLRRPGCQLDDQVCHYINNEEQVAVFLRRSCQDETFYFY